MSGTEPVDLATAIRAALSDDVLAVMDGRGRTDGNRHRCLANDGVTELMFAEEDVLWTKAQFGCVVHKPVPVTVRIVSDGEEPTT